MELCNPLLQSYLFLVNNNRGWQWDWNIDSRYTIKRIVGNGSYGDVAEAIDTRTNKSVSFLLAYQIGCN